MTTIPQLISPTEVSKKLGISKKTLGKLGFTKFKFNARVVRYSETEITKWLERRANIDVYRFNAEGSNTQPHGQPVPKLKRLKRALLKNGSIDVSAILKSVRYQKP